jgi:hypothetical protein
MKKKLLIAVGVFFVLVVIVIVALSVLVKTYLKSEQLKALIIPRAEEFTGREVSIERIDVSLFKGIVVKKLDIKEDGRDFVSVEEFVLAYDLMPLLRKELVIHKVELISPRIHIKRLKDGSFNFSDIIERPEEEKKAPEEEAGGLPVSLVTDRVLLKDAKLQFIDEMKEIPDISVETDADFKVSLKDKIGAEGYLDLKKLEATLGGIRTSTAGRIDIKKDLIKADITSTIDGKPIDLKATVKDYSGSPEIEFKLDAEELDLDKLMALAGTGKAGKKRETSPGPAPSGKAKEELLKIKASGTVDVKAAKYGDIRVTDLSLDAGSSLEVAPSDKSVTGEVELRKLSAAVEGISANASGKATLGKNTVKASLRSVIDIPASYSFKKYTVEQAHVDASPRLTYDLGKKNLSGNVGITDLSVAALKSKDLSVTGIQFSGNTDIAYNVPSGKLKADAEIKGLRASYKGMEVSTSGKVSYDGNTITAVLKDASAKAAEYIQGEYTVTGLDLLADTDLTVSIEKKEPRGTVNLKTFKANINGADISVAGKVSSDGKTARAVFKEATVRADEYTHKDYKIKNLDVSAVTDLKVSLKDKKPTGGSVELKKFTANVNGIETAATGKVKADTKKLTADLKVNIDKDSIKLSATARDYRTAPDVKFNVYSKRLDIDKLTALSSPKEKETPEGKPAPQKEEKPTPLTARGTIKIDKADYKDYNIKDLSVTLKYVNDVMTADPMKMILTGGTSMVIDGAFLGNVSFKYPRGSADAAAVMKRTMSGKGVSKFKKIQMNDVKVADAIARLTSVEELRNPTFTDSEFDCAVKNQKVNLDGFMNSERIRVITNGFVGLDKAIDMDVQLNLDPMLSRRLIVTQLIREKDGTSTLPLIIKGTTDDPKVSIDTRKGLKKLFEGIFPQKHEEPPPPTAPTQEQPPAQEEPQAPEQIKKLFEGIFGK